MIHESNLRTNQVITKDGKYLAEDITTKWDKYWTTDIFTSTKWNMELDDPTKVHHEKPEELVGAKLITIETSQTIKIL